MVAGVLPGEPSDEVEEGCETVRLAAAALLGGTQDAQASGGAVHGLACCPADQAPGRSCPGIHVEVQDSHAIVQQRIQPRSILCSEYGRRVLISERQLDRSERILRVLRSLRDPSLLVFTQMCAMIGEEKRQRRRRTTFTTHRPFGIRGVNTQWV